jgi:bifunctional DNA-binding transcriptional regulator/antitoxin component of YhaV-PrlF toxin-antitoxin module
MTLVTRKVQQLNSTSTSYIITLPKNWVEGHGIEKGDSLEFHELEDGSLLIKRKG